MTDTSPMLKLENVSLKLPLAGKIRRNETGSKVGGVIVRGTFGNHVLALDGINLDVQAGSRIAVIGANGAGKTTLLRLAAGIYSPSSGKRLVKGRVTCLLTSSLGLSPALSGRENIRLACALYGIGRKEMKDLAPEIEEFSELGAYLDVQIGTYSAGMKTRLGMSIITALNPDILLIDEVFGAGDNQFAEKSRSKLLDMLAQSRILIFSSHAEPLLRQLCTTAVLLDHGKLIATGSVDEVLLKYKTTTV